MSRECRQSVWDAFLTLRNDPHFSQNREEHSMDECRPRRKLSENFQDHWSILISGNSYGPIIGPYLFLGKFVWTNGPESFSKVSPYTGIGPWMAHFSQNNSLEWRHLFCIEVHQILPRTCSLSSSFPFWTHKKKKRCRLGGFKKA